MEHECWQYADSERRAALDLELKASYSKDRAFELVWRPDRIWYAEERGLYLSHLKINCYPSSSQDMFTSQSLRILIQLWGISNQYHHAGIYKFAQYQLAVQVCPEAEENLTISNLVKKHRSGRKAFKICNPNLTLSWGLQGSSQQVPMWSKPQGTIGCISSPPPLPSPSPLNFPSLPLLSLPCVLQCLPANPSFQSWLFSNFLDSTCSPSLII